MFRSAVSTVLLALVLFISACSGKPEAEPLAGSTPPADSSADALTGMWSGDWGPSSTDRNPVTLDLKWEAGNLTGTVNPGPDAVQLTKASYDSATGNVMMEADAKGRTGDVVHYMIEGRLEGTAMMGTWMHGDQKGDFTITRKP